MNLKGHILNLYLFVDFNNIKLEDCINETGIFLPII